MHADGWMDGWIAGGEGEMEEGRYSDPTEEVIFPKQSLTESLNNWTASVMQYALGITQKFNRDV